MGNSSGYEKIKFYKYILKIRKKTADTFVYLDGIFRIEKK